MDTFRIAFRPTFNSPTETRFVEAETARAAVAMLGVVWGIRSIQLRCQAVNKTGHRCSQYSPTSLCNFHQRVLTPKE